MPEIITLYTAKVCPYAQRAELALEEAKADYTKFEIDLSNKPEWYAPLVNPASKVPAIAYGGPKVPPEQPSPKSVKIAESLIIVEFVADLFPEASLLPKDPVLRAKARFFVDAVSTKFTPTWFPFVAGKGSAEDFIKGTEQVQALLPESGFAIGQYSIADIAITPFLARAELLLRHAIGAYSAEEAKKVYETVWLSPKFSRLQKYWNDVKARPNFKASFDEVCLITER
ncbi:glutathione S-transferase C-terminal-like protein [Sparassis latifolia]